jgi:diguanylate cyclase (GGDEF)-like protein/PAS domain S-box-containing protein
MPLERLRNLRDPEVLHQFMEKLRDGIYIANAAGEILDANAACLKIFGVSSLDELLQRPLQDLFANPARRAEEMRLLTRNGEVQEFELVVRGPDGTERPVLDICQRSQDPETGELLVHGILIDISNRRQLEARFHEASLRDPLTGCFNRRYLLEFQQRSRPQDSWGVIVVDVDDFKEHNDLFGHQAGDDVLIRVSRFLLANARGEDAVVRMGGDEFLLLLVGAPARFVAEVGRRLRATAAEQGIPPFSIGWATRHGSEPLERTIDHADRELLQIRLFERRSRQTRPRGPRQRLLEEILIE